MTGKLLGDKGLTEKQAVEFLRKKGYTVVPPQNTTSKVSSSALIDYFYANLELKAGKEFIVTLPSDRSKDRKAITKVNKKYQLKGMTIAECNNHLYHILSVLFKHYDDLGLQSHVDSLECILPGGPMSWVLRKALSLEKKHKKEFYYSSEFNAIVDSLCEQPSSAFMKHRDLKGKFLLERVDKHVKKENRK